MSQASPDTPTSHQSPFGLKAVDKRISSLMGMEGGWAQQGPGAARGKRLERTDSHELLNNMASGLFVCACLSLCVSVLWRQAS